MQKHLRFVFLLIFLPHVLIAQILPEPCTIQAEMSLGICFDPPGCWTFSVETIGGIGPYTYSWSNGSTSDSYVYSNPQNPYMGSCESVTVTDGNGCIAIIGDVHNIQDPPTFSLMPDTILADPGPTGFDISLNDFIDTVFYELVQPTNFGTIVFNENGSGTYTPDGNWCGPDYFRYLVRDTMCNYSDIVTATIINGPCAGILLTDKACNGTCTGGALFYNQGVFVPPLSYAWSNGETDVFSTGLCGGNVSVTITDAMGTMETYNAEVEEATLETSILGLDQSCQNNKVFLEPQYIQSPSGNVDFFWSGPGIYSSLQYDTTQLQYPGHPDSVNVFQVIINSTNGCSDTASHIVNAIDAPRINELILEKIVCPIDTVEIRALTSEGTPPFSYHWIGPLGVQASTPEFSWPNATSDYSGTYKLKISDVNGCTASKNKNVNIPNSLIHAVNALGPNETVCQESDVELSWGTTQGGWTVPEKVEWTGPNGYFSNETNPIVQNIQASMAGFYFVKVFYGEDCYAMDSVEVFVSNEIASVTDLQIIPPTGCYTNDAQVTVTMSFPPPYEVDFSWSGFYPDFTTNPFTITNAQDGDYHSMEIILNDCVIIQELDIPEPAIPNIVTTDPTCLGEDGTGTILSPNAPQIRARWQLPDAAWNDYEEGLFIEGLLPLTYNVYITDSVTNCQFTEEVTLDPYLNFEILPVDTPSCTDTNGSLEVLELGQAVPPVSYEWSNGNSGNLNTNLAYGWYSMTMTDGDGCERHENVFLPADESCFSVISGNAYVNYDCDCTADGNDFPYANLKVCAQNGTYIDCYYTDNTGAYWIAAPFEGEYTLTVYPNHDFLQEACFPQAVTVTNDPTNISDVDFFFCSDSITDLGVYPYCGVARPGFNQDYTFRVTNHGTVFADTATLVVDLSDDLEIIQITPTPESHNPATNEIVWNIYNIPFNSFENYKVKAIVNAELGDVLLTTAEVITNNDDVAIENNTSFCEQEVIGSFDPNDKTVSPLGNRTEGDISLADTLLTYTIRFQNTGTDTAFTVILRDTLDADVFDLNSVEPRIASHPYQLDVEDENILVFYFENINLPDSTRSLEGSQGYVTFDINLKPDLPLGTVIQNSADIFFDFNLPISTNTTINILTEDTNGYSTSSNSPVCEGMDVFLTATGGDSYEWSGPNGFVSPDQNPVLYSTIYNMSGTYTVRINNNDGSIMELSTDVIINNLPTAGIDGELEFCDGESTTLTANGGTGYNWSTGENTASIAATSSDDYLVTVTDNNDCTDTASVTVSVNELPTAGIDGDLEFCDGESTTLTATGGTGYNWSTGENTASIAATSSDDYLVTVTDNNDCTDTASVTVSVNELPPVDLTMGQDTFCINEIETELVGGTPVGGVYSGPSVSNNFFDPSVAGLGIHTISYTYTDVTTDCSNVAEQEVIVLDNTASNCLTAVQNIENIAMVKVFPNPSDGDFTILFEKWIGEVKIRIFDIQGREIYFDESIANLIQIQNIPRGIFMLKLSSNEFSLTRKLIIH